MMEKLFVFCLLFLGCECTTQEPPQATFDTYYVSRSGGSHRVGSIRLVNGYSDSSGRIEIYYNGRWGTVCDDNFDYKDAQVICRMLGFRVGSGLAVARGSASFGPGTGDILIDELQCTGSEHDITLCPANIWGSHDCGHAEDAGVDCEWGVSTGSYAGLTGVTPPNSYATGSIRLVNGHSARSGRVEVFYAGQWGTICDDSFDFRDAQAICRILGFHVSPGYGAAYDLAHFGQGTGRINIDDLQCNGDETFLTQCRSRRWGSHNCDHSEDAGVDCDQRVDALGAIHTDYNPQITTDYTPLTRSTARTPKLLDVRLVGSSSSGRVEIFISNEWLTVCIDAIDHNVAMVICRSVGQFYGYNYGDILSSSSYGQGSSSSIIHYIGCNGNEAKISQCSTASSPWAPSSHCTHSKDAALNCAGYSNLYHQQMTTDDPFQNVQTTEVITEGQVRLVGGASSGRVEIYHNGQWMTVCSNTLDYSDIMVICKSIGQFYGTSYGRKHWNSYYGSGTSSYIIHYLGCHGYETRLSQCGFQDSYRNSRCSHWQDVGIDCAGYRYEVTTVNPYQYRQTTEGHTLEDAITVSCNEFGWDITVNMYKLRQRYPNARADSIYMGENSCVGYDNGYNLHFTQDLRQCLTSQMIRNDVLVYRNQLVYAERDPLHPFLIRHYNWTVDVECDVMRNETASGHLHHNTGGSSNHQISGTSHYPVNMSYYSDPNFRYQLNGYPLSVNVGDKVYVKVFSPTSDWTIKMKVHTCYTKPSNAPSTSQLYYIIKNGCEVDSNTHIISQSTHETRFVFEDFEYASNHEGIYIYCDATFCPSSDYSSSCSQTCNPVIRRRNLPLIDRADEKGDNIGGGHKPGVTDEPRETTEEMVEDVTETP